MFIQIIVFVVIGIVIFLLMSVSEKIESSKTNSKKKKMSKIVVSLLLSILLTVFTGVIYDYVKTFWYQESVSMGVLRGSYPFFAKSNEEYGNLRITLTQEGDRSIEGLQVFIQYPNSEYQMAMIREYSNPEWFILEPLEYQIIVSSSDSTYMQSYPCKIEENYKTALSLPVY